MCMLIFCGLECDLNTGIAQNLLCTVFLQCIKVGLSVSVRKTRNSACRIFLVPKGVVTGPWGPQKV